MPRKKPAVLIVDDDSEINKMLREFFTRKGFAATAVESGLLGLKLLGGNKFDVVISDIKMPGIDGLEFVARAKKLQPETVMMLITGFASLSSAQQAIKAGVQEYFTKPVDLNLLLGSVNASLKAIEGRKKVFEGEIRKKLSRERREIEKFKTELMILINHEIRTPLAIMSAGLDLLKDSINPGESGILMNLDRDTTGEIFENIQVGRRRLIQIVEDINYLFRLTRGGEAVKTAEVELNDFFGQNMDGLHCLIAAYSGQIKFTPSPKKLNAVLDREKFMDVMARVVESAVRRRAGTVEIKVVPPPSRRGPGGRGRKSFASVVISDDGLEIDEKTLKDIFKPLVTGDIWQHREGLGIDLVISKKVIDLMGGDISVSSGAGKPTEVVVKIPCRG